MSKITHHICDLASCGRKAMYISIPDTVFVDPINEYDRKGYAPFVRRELDLCELHFEQLKTHRLFIKNVLVNDYYFGTNKTKP